MPTPTPTKDCRMQRTSTSVDKYVNYGGDHSVKYTKYSALLDYLQRRDNQIDAQKTTQQKPTVQPTPQQYQQKRSEPSPQFGKLKFSDAVAGRKPKDIPETRRAQRSK